MRRGLAMVLVLAASGCVGPGFVNVSRTLVVPLPPPPPPAVEPDERLSVWLGTPFMPVGVDPSAPPAAWSTTSARLPLLQPTAGVLVKLHGFLVGGSFEAIPAALSHAAGPGQPTLEEGVMVGARGNFGWSGQLDEHIGLIVLAELRLHSLPYRLSGGAAGDETAQTLYPGAALLVTPTARIGPVTLFAGAGIGTDLTSKSSAQVRMGCFNLCSGGPIDGMTWQASAGGGVRVRLIDGLGLGLSVFLPLKRDEVVWLPVVSLSVSAQRNDDEAPAEPEALEPRPAWPPRTVP